MPRTCAGRLGVWFAALALAGAGCPAFAQKSDAPIRLPPMIINESTVKRPWRYVAASGMEILARCDDDVTLRLVRRSLRLSALLRSVLPENLQFQPFGPGTVILADAAAAPSLSRELLAQSRSKGVSSDFARSNSPAISGWARRIEVLPNLELRDVDHIVVFAIANESTFSSDQLVFTTAHMRYMAEHRTPPLPRWFTDGFTTLIRDAEFGNETIRFPRLLWISGRETKRIRDDADAPRRVQPLADFLSEKPGANPDEDREWESQAALFVRWALSEPELRQALWRFVADAAVAGQSEARFQSCFGMSYADARDRVSDYLPVAIDRPLVIRPAHLAPAPPLHPRDATAAEVGRMKGEWERMAALYVRTFHARFAPQYVQLARQTLDRALRRSPDDPAILAEKALLECDSKNFEAARPLLEAAVAAGQVRPRAYVELAALRMADALATVHGTSGLLTAADAAPIVRLLDRAESMSPPIAKAYELSVELWARTMKKLDAADIVRLKKGLNDFPDDLRLLYWSAVVVATRGDVSSAAVLVAQGEADAVTADQRTVFSELQTRLDQFKGRSKQAK